jgi:hypothetical protein
MDRDEQVVFRPVATATVGLHELRASAKGPFAIEISLDLVDGKRSDDRVGQTMTIARQALEGYSPAPGEHDRRKFQEVLSMQRDPTGVRAAKVTAIRANAMSNERPSGEAMRVLCGVLADAGFKVVLRERRECSQPGCSTEALTDFTRPDDIPTAWFSAITCGKHQFKQCRRCNSVYLLTATNAAGQAPSVHCLVCDQVLIEWGGSKRWEAELITRGTWGE